MLEKATKDDIASFQAFTIRNLDSKLSTESDTDQYKVINIQEDPLDNRQKYLDVICFPGLFPNGHFGEFHPREKKSLTVNILNHGYLIKILVEKMHNMYFICFGKKKCESFQQVCTIC